MNATAQINGCDAETRARVLKQIEDRTTQSDSPMITAAAPLEDNNHSSTYTDAENLARRIISRLDSVAAKLRSLEDDIRRLWVEFDKLEPGQTILGCATKKEFCEKKLHRTPRAIQYLLAGQSNPADRPHGASELSSPPRATEPLPMSRREAARQEYKKAHPESSTESNHKIDEKIRRAYQQRSEAEPEMHWLSKKNHCPTGKRGFDCPDDIWQAMRAEGTIGATDFVAYIGNCGQCGRCHKDKDQSMHEAGDAARARHQTWYRSDELNQQPKSLALKASAVVRASDKINSLLPYFGDGIEHEFICDIREVCARLAQPDATLPDGERFDFEWLCYVLNQA